MSIKRSSRMLVATCVVASLSASPAMASGGPMDQRSPDAKDAATRSAITIDKRSPDVQDVARASGGTVADGRVTSSLAGPPAAPGTGALPGPPEFPTNTTVLARPAEPVTVRAPSAGDRFDVGDAFVGAAGSVVLLVSVAGGLALSRRRRIATAA